MKKTIVLKTALFLIVFGIILSVVYKVMVSHGDVRNYQWIAGFYDERKNSHDAVFLGGSNTYSLWEAPIAWHDYGITVYPFASNAQPLEAALPLIKEARKTQPDALYIANINSIFAGLNDIAIYSMTEYMPFSVDRFRIVNYLCKMARIPFKNRLQFYFPLYRFHSRWNELKKEDFHYTNEGIKGASTYSIFLNAAEDSTKNFTTTTRRTAISASLQKSLEDLLDYCDAEGVRVLFITSPQAVSDEVFWAKINTIIDLVQARGYPCLNTSEHMEEMGLDLTTDYYNYAHTNIHGALKITKFLSEYLVKNYGFKDKRGESGYSDWDDAYKKYMEIITPYVLDIETNYEKRDYTLPAPKLNNVSVNGTTLTVSWGTSERAEGYRIYRKEENSAWKMIAETEADVLRYIDNKCERNKTYTYTVVPWHIKDGEKTWGKFNINGVKGRGLLNAPVLVSANKTDNGVKISWKKVNGAAGYKIYRRLPAKNWIMIGEAGNTDYYVDTAVLENLPFCYTVKGYTVDKENRKVDGSFNSDGILYLPELIMPTVKSAVNNKEITLSWTVAEGMNGYKVYRNEELIADLPAGSTEFTEKEKSSTDTYRVEAYFKVGSVIYTFNLVNAR